MKLFAVGDLLELSVFFHGAIPAELGLGLGVGLFGRVPAGAGIPGLNASSNLGGDAKTDVSSAHGGEADDSFCSVFFVVHGGFSSADFV